MLEVYSCRSSLTAGAFALEYVCSIGAIHLPAVPIQTLHSICPLPVIGTCHAAMTGATLIVTIHIPNPRCLRATVDEGFQDSAPFTG